MNILNKMTIYLCVITLMISGLHITEVRANEQDINNKLQPMSEEVTAGEEENTVAEEESEEEETSEETTEEATAPETTVPQTTVPETTAEVTTKPVETSTTQQPTTAKQPETTVAEKKTAWGKYKGNYYNDKGVIIKGATAKGIDISKYQGKIDWEKVAKEDISFVIIRCGYGSNMKSQDDPYFKANVEGCKKYNIPYGIYLYSYATNKSMMKSEVKHVLRLIKEAKANPEYPVYIDMEDSTQYVLSNKTLTNLADYFCAEILKSGYKAGIYANLSWWTYKLNDKSLNQWYRWVAQYNSYCAFTGPYHMWQYTSQGKSKGISGNLDVNFLFDTYCSTHGSGKWKTTKKSTVLAKGEKRYICSKCGLVTSIKKIAKLKPTGKLNKKTIKLKFNKKYKKLKVKKMAKGDYVVKYKSSNKKIATVNKKGVITAGRKKGTAKITVTLKSGKKLKLKVVVRRK